MIIYLTGNKELRLIMILVHGKRFYLEYCKVLRLILFYIFLNDLFFVMKETEFTSYAGDKTLYDVGNTIENLILCSQETSRKLSKWFSNNQMQGNCENLIESTNCEKLLGVKID